MTAESRNGEARAESIARQWLAKSMFRGNEQAWRNQRVTPRLTHVSWQRMKQRITEGN
jgi:hypothetical protein